MITALQILGVWVLLDVLVLVPLWVAAHGGLKDPR